MSMEYQRKNKIKRKNIFAKLGYSIKYSLDGLKYAYKYEQSMIIHLSAILITVALGIWLQIDIKEWAICIFSLGMIMATELLNTAIEATVDLCSPEIHPLAKMAKDTASAAVFIASIVAAMAELVIFIPKIMELL